MTSLLVATRRTTVSDQPADVATKTRLRDLLTASVAVVAVSFRSTPARALAAFFLEPVAAATGALLALFLKIVADSALGGDVGHALLGALALAASFGLGRAMGTIGLRLRMNLQERVAFAFEAHLARVVAAVPGLAPLERPAYLDQLALLRRERDTYWYSLSATVQGLREIVRLLSTLGLLAAIDPRLLLLLALGLPALLGGIAARRSSERAAEETAEDERLVGHLLELATSPGPGRELRIFALAEEIERRWAAAAARADEKVVRATVRAALWQTLGWLGFAVGFVGGVALITVRAVQGSATPGDALLVWTLAGGVAGNVRSVATWISELVAVWHFLARYVAVTREAEGSVPNHVPRLHVPTRLEQGIVIECLSFRYPDTDSWVLRDVTLHLPAGSTIALVGENGAGKTTLIKLLARFYEPTDGRILIDGTDLAQVDLTEWRRRISAGFQDFARLDLLAREAVGVGDPPRIDDEPAVRAALERAGGADVIDQLERGLATRLGTTWDGIDLSGGQWQKLALGRAMMREDPLLLILDEPTASLDAETEYVLFQRYARAARDAARRAGSITILVSHRFSTVRAADLIVVLDGGRIREVGSHEHLLAAHGLYAELFDLQARAYRG
jgi:ATP-binding cassette subfamily B protein